VNSALQDDWQVLTKSSGGRRPAALGRHLAADAWLELRPDDRWVAPVVAPVAFARPVQWLAVRWRTLRGELKQGIVVCSVEEWSPSEVIAHYDARGACETEIQADKAGLRLTQRRKKRLAAQEALILLTDLAHNLLAWTGQWMFPVGPLAGMGPTRLVEDVLAIPGHLIFHQQELLEVQLNVRHPYAADVAVGLERLLDHFGYP